ncbi:MAG: nucleoside phosphorylase [bacterium]|nr:nucleoside phosphorylase [bacterium]
MEKTLFNPKKFDVPQNLVLVPQFWDKPYLQQLKKEAVVSFDHIGCEVLLFQDYTMITGFLGYPNLLTVLEFIEDVKEKDVFFLGTAGSMNPEIDTPIIMEVEEIFPTSILEHFSEASSFPLKTFGIPGARKVRGVTIDIIQRETPSWLEEQQKRGMDFVEMEIFPLAAYLQKPFHAVVISSDLLKVEGIQVFPDKKKLKEEFVNAYRFIVQSFR